MARSHWFLVAAALVGLVSVGLALSTYSHTVTALNGVVAEVSDFSWDPGRQTARVCLGFTNKTGVRVYLDQAVASNELLFVTPHMKFNRALQTNEPVTVCDEKQPGFRAQEILGALGQDGIKWYVRGTAWLTVGPQSLELPLRFRWAPGEGRPR